jgi:Clp amino terminal domain, pathogenicity island component
LGLVKEEGGNAAQVLKNLDVTLEAVRDEVVRYSGDLTGPIGDLWHMGGRRVSCRLVWTYWHENGQEDAGGHFEIGPISAERNYSLVIDASGFAQARVGPFDPHVSPQHVRVEMQKPGTVRCIVRRPDATLMPMAWVLRHRAYRPFQRSHAASTDSSGVALLKDVGPGRYHVSAKRQGDQHPGHVQKEIRVRPGQVTEVTLTLAK